MILNMTNVEFHSLHDKKGRECIGLVMEYMTWDRGVVGSSLNGGTVLCP